MKPAVVGWVHTPFGRHDDLDLEALITTVSRAAIADAGIAAADVDAIWLGHLNGGFVPEIFCSSLVLEADDALRWKPATRVENVCASGATGLQLAGQAGEMQVEDASLAGNFNMGGSAVASYVTIPERVL